MKQISNWVFGSFFRTIGRLLVFVLIGVLIANFVDFGNLKDNFSITNLLGIEKISALTLTQDVEVFDSKVIDITNSDLTSEILYKRKYYKYFNSWDELQLEERRDYEERIVNNSIDHLDAIN